MRRIVTFVFAAAFCGSLSACGSSSLSARSPQAVRAAIVAAALAQKSVHWTEIGYDSSSGRAMWTSDVNGDSGTQRVTIDMSRDRGGEADIRLVDHTVYVRGNPVGLRGTLHLTNTQATRYASQWISIPPGDKLYARTADGLTLASIVHDFTPSARPRLVRTTVHGARLLEVQESRLLLKSLSAPASGEPLPVAFGESFGPGQGVRGSFSRWNEPVHVQPPASSTPIAIVRGSPEGVLASIVAAGLAQKSVHLTATVGEDLFGTTTFTADVGGNSASERIEYGGATMHLLVFRHAVYLRGDALLLEERLGLTQGEARRFAGKWIWVPRTRGDKLYADLTDGLTLASVVRRAARMVNLKLTTGTSFLVVRGTPANTLLPVDELRARANGTPLPVAFSGFEPGVSTSGRFSKWNEPVEISLPKSSTPIAIVRGG